MSMRHPKARPGIHAINEITGDGANVGVTVEANHRAMTQALMTIASG